MNEQISLGFSHNGLDIMAGGLDIVPLVDGAPQPGTNVFVGITEVTVDGRKCLYSISQAILEFRQSRGV
jgi:hypothetical protein